MRKRHVSAVQEPSEALGKRRDSSNPKKSPMGRAGTRISSIGLLLGCSMDIVRQQKRVTQTEGMEVMTP